MSPKKCHLFRDRVKYVGHVVSVKGVETDPDKIKKVADWPVPTNNAELRTFLGFSGYYRRFVKNFAQITKPLTHLLTGDPKYQKKKKFRSTKKTVAVEWRWGDAEQDAFDAIKGCLISSPILAYPVYNQPFILHTDASGKGLGAVLYQNIDGVERVISYASRQLNKAESHYPAHKLEFLALKWAVTQKFHDYLYGCEFVVYTDNNPLTYVMGKAKLDAVGHRWVAALNAYNFTIHYRPGRANGDADGLSRRPDDTEYQELSKETINALCQSHTGLPYVTSLSLAAGLLDDMDLNMEVVPRKWRPLQVQDDVIGQFHRAVVNKRKPDITTIKSADGLTLLREYAKLTIRRGVLYRQIQIQGEPVYQLLLPKQYRSPALTSAHDNMGHLSRDKTLGVLRERVYWPNMTAEVEQWIKHCDRCIRQKTSTNIHAPLVNITSTYPMEIVCMDFLTLEPSKGGYQHLLVITDHFTKFAVAIPTRNQTAKRTADTLFNNFVVSYGLPRRLHNDQGANFESKLIKELCTLTGMNKSRTTPYHPQSDGITERFNRTLLSMLGTLDPSKKADWRAEVAPLVHAYNCTRHDTTGFSPYLLMFGRQPKIALDVVLGLVNDEHEEVDYGKYMATMRSRLKQAYEQASKNMMSSQERQSRNYNKRARAASLDVGDQVLVKVVSFDGKHKIADKWEEVPYIVMDQPYADIPVYAVQKENRSGPRRTLHRNLLLPISHLPVAEIQNRSTITSRKGPLPSTQEEDPTESIAEDSDEEYLVEEIVNSREHAHVPTA